MILFPNAKINLGLNILRKRPDGYHDIESCFYPVKWCDALEIIPSEKLSFRPYGIDIPGDPKTNLCIQAYQNIKSKYDIPPVTIHLLKNIPIGAGLGGGSADAAFTLKGLNSIFELEISDHELSKEAAKIGSDCPFFIENKQKLAINTGTEFKQTSVDLKGMWILLVYPEIHISSKTAYAGVKPNTPNITTADILRNPISEWKHLLHNDFENSVFPQHPEIEQLKNNFYKNGAVYASLTGSGSAVYGLFDSEPEDDILTSFPHWKGQLD